MIIFNKDGSHQKVKIITTNYFNGIVSLQRRIDDKHELIENKKELVYKREKAKQLTINPMGTGEMIARDTYNDIIVSLGAATNKKILNINGVLGLWAGWYRSVSDANTVKATVIAGSTRTTYSLTGLSGYTFVEPPFYYATMNNDPMGSPGIRYGSATINLNPNQILSNVVIRFTGGRAFYSPEYPPYGDVTTYHSNISGTSSNSYLIITYED